MAAQNTYPAFFYHTNFDIGNARVASIDLNEVATSSDPKTTSLFFQIVRMFIKRKFAVSRDDIPKFPQAYREYATQLINELLEDRKIMSYDELHVAKGDPILLEELAEDARTLRKWGARLNLASHKVEDFKDLVGFATAYVIVDPGTRESREAIRDSIGLTQLEMDALGSGNVGFSDQGLTYFSKIKLEKWNVRAYIPFHLVQSFYGHSVHIPMNVRSVTTRMTLSVNVVRR